MLRPTPKGVWVKETDSVVVVKEPVYLVTCCWLPIPSSAMRLQRSEALDAWGHTYCISELKTAIVVSGGPEAASFCSQQKTPAHEIASAARSIFQASSGEVVVVLKNGEVEGTPDARPE